MVPVAQSRQILEHHETIGRQGLKYFGTYHLDCFQIKATSDRKALTRISNPLHWNDSNSLAQLCLALPCTEGFLLLVWVTDLNLAIPLAGFVQLNEDKSVFCTTNRWHKAFFNSRPFSKHARETAARLLFCTLINATLQVSHASNSPLLNWYWVRLLDQTQKIMITVYTPQFCKWYRLRFSSVVNYNQSSRCFCNNAKAPYRLYPYCLV